MAAVITAGLATLHELKTLYDSEDLYYLLEILSVRNWNAAHVGNAD
ncbi:hypothetical protein [Acetobacter sp. P1H12_c]|nr:hypothetical protein [Acetobacter sp. P1H12_c]